MKSLIIWLILSVSYSPPIDLSSKIEYGPIFLLPALPKVVPVKIEFGQPPWPKFEVVPPLPNGFGPKSLNLKGLR